VSATASPVTRISVSLTKPANDMVQEEITKRVHHLSKGIANVAFEEGGTRLVFDAPADQASDLTARAADAAQRVQRSLRNLARNVVYKSHPADSPTFKGDGNAAGVIFTGPGQVALRGLPLAVFELYLRVQDRAGAQVRYAMAAGLFVLAALIAFGSHAAYTFVWSPFLWKLDN